MVPFRNTVAVAALLAGFATTSVSYAQSPEDAMASSARTIQSYDKNINSVKEAIAISVRPERTSRQRLADGDLLLRARDYERATVVFNQVVDTEPKSSAAFAEALFSLGETYFLSDQHPSARRVFLRIINEGRTGRLAPYRPRALARLTDIALRSRNQQSLDDQQLILAESATTSGDAVLSYSRARILLARNDAAGAKVALQSVAPNSRYYHQACYLLGVVTLRESSTTIQALPEADQKNSRTLSIHYANSIEAFRRVTQLPLDSESHRHVVDLGWLALGRLLYETDQLMSAVDAYGHVGRESVEFSNALFETAAVHVEMGDALRAQRSLEVLAVVDPEGAQAAEAGLLRGDLELRTKLFDKALVTFEGVRSQFEPMHERVKGFLEHTSDPAVFYDKLIEDQLASDEIEQLPSLAIRWAREGDQGTEAFSVVNEVVQTRTLLRQTEEIAAKLNAMMSSPARSKAFPDLRAGQQTALGAIHALLKARVSLANALESLEQPNLSGEIATVRTQRRALQERALALPTTASDFQKRETAAENRWNRAAQRVHQLQIQVDTLQSVVNALQRVLRDGASIGEVRDPATAARFREELAGHEQDLATYRATVTRLRQQSDQGRIASGYDDIAVFEDGDVRERYKVLFAKEVELASQGAAGAAAASYAQRIAPFLRSADSVEAKYDAALLEINQTVDRKANQLLMAIATEEAKVAGYRSQLQGLDQNARFVVGEVAMRNFGLVGERLRGIVMRADVGMTEQAWEAREEQLVRVRKLQTERAQSERLLNEEMREVLDDAMGE